MSINKLSTEILQKVYDYTTIQDVFHLAQTSKKNYRAFLGRRMHILTQSMHNTYSPLPELLKLVIANTPDKNRKLLSTELRRNAIVNRIIEIQELPKLTVEIMIKMVEFGKLANRWVEIYPRIRWRQHSNDRRLLRSDEATRLRGAIYSYWTYNTLFHDPTFLAYDPDLPRSHEDPRLRLLRTYSTLQLVQLTEFTDKMQQILQVDLYPSYTMLRSQFHLPVPQKLLYNMAWADGSPHRSLILDCMKYTPTDLLHLFENTTMKKEREDYFWKQGKQFMDSPATLRDSIAMVHLQRNTGIKLETCIFEEEIEYGIIDNEDGKLAWEKSVYANDGCRTAIGKVECSDRLESDWSEEED